MKKTVLSLLCWLCYLHLLGQATTFADPASLALNELKQKVAAKHNVQLSSIQELKAPYYVATEKNTMRPAIIDDQGEFVIPFGQYDVIRIFKFGFHNHGLCMLYRKDTKRVSIYNLQDRKIIGTFDGASSHEGGYLVVKDKSGSGVIDLTGTIIHPLIYDKVQIASGPSFFLTRGDTLFLKDANKAINYIPNVLKLRINHSGTQVFNGEKWGIASKDLRLTTPFIYDSLLYFYDGGLFVAEQDGKFGLIDVDNNKIVPVEFRHVSDFVHCRKKYLAGVMEDNVTVYDKEGKKITELPLTETEYKNSRFITFGKVMAGKMSAAFPCE